MAPTEALLRECCLQRETGEPPREELPAEVPTEEPAQESKVWVRAK